MKKNIAEFVAQCTSCQQVKVEHQKPGGLMQTIEIPTWKWEAINMDFIMGLPRSNRKFDSIWVIVDRLTKSAHFLPVRSTYTAEDYAKLYIKEIVRLHGVPISIISYCGALFTAHFWRSFQRGLGTQVNLSITFHPRAQFRRSRICYEHVCWILKKVGMNIYLLSSLHIITVTTPVSRWLRTRLCMGVSADLL